MIESAEARLKKLVQNDHAYLAVFRAAIRF